MVSSHDNGTVRVKYKSAHKRNRFSFAHSKTMVNSVPISGHEEQNTNT